MWNISSHLIHNWLYQVFISHFTGGKNKVKQFFRDLHSSDFNSVYQILLLGTVLPCLCQLPYSSKTEKAQILCNSLANLWSSEMHMQKKEAQKPIFTVMDWGGKNNQDRSIGPQRCGEKKRTKNSLTMRYYQAVEQTEQDLYGQISKTTSEARVMAQELGTLAALPVWILALPLIHSVNLDKPSVKWGQ